MWLGAQTPEPVIKFELWLSNLLIMLPLVSFFNLSVPHFLTYKMSKTLNLPRRIFHDS